MSEFKSLNWRCLPGNKYSKALEPSMLTEQGCLKNQSVRHCHSPKGEMFNVIYDKEYVLTFLSKRIISNLCVIGKDKIHDLIDQAWDTTFDENAVGESTAS